MEFKEKNKKITNKMLNNSLHVNVSRKHIKNLISNLKNILNEKTSTLEEKQIKIEELYSFYKKEKTRKMTSVNPFWSGLLLQLFKDPLLKLKKPFDILQIELNESFEKLGFFNGFDFQAKEILSFVIYYLIDNRFKILTNTKTNNLELSIQLNTFINDLSDKFIEMYETDICQRYFVYLILNSVQSNSDKFLEPSKPNNFYKYDYVSIESDLKENYNVFSQNDVLWKFYENFVCALKQDYDKNYQKLSHFEYSKLIYEFFFEFCLTSKELDDELEIVEDDLALANRKLYGVKVSPQKKKSKLRALKKKKQKYKKLKYFQLLPHLNKLKQLKKKNTLRLNETHTVSEIFYYLFLKLNLINENESKALFYSSDLFLKSNQYLFNYNSVSFLNYKSELKIILNKFFAEFISISNKFQIFEIYKSLKNQRPTIFITLSDFPSLNINSVVEKDELKRYRNPNDQLFSKNIFDFLYLSSQLPMIVKPRPWKIQKSVITKIPTVAGGGYLLGDNYLNKFVHRLKKGSSKFLPSSKFVNAINLIQNKSYTVSNDFLDLMSCEENFCKLIDILPYAQLKKQTKTYNTKKNLFIKFLNENNIDLSSYEQEYNYFITFSKDNAYFVNFCLNLQNNNSIDIRLQNLIETEKLSLFNKDHFKRIFILYLQIKYNVTNDNITTLLSLRKERNSYFSLSVKSTYFYYLNYEFAKLFKKYILYYANFIDSRGRYYVISLIFSRLSGVLKYMLESSDKKSYMTSDKKLNVLALSWLKIFIVENLGFTFKTKQEYLVFFDSKLHGFIIKHRLCLKENSHSILDYVSKTFNVPVKKPIPFLLAISEYKNVFSIKDYVSGFMIDIDQSNSGSQILSLLAKIKDNNLLQLTNISSVNEKNDLYQNFCDYMQINYKNNCNYVLDCNKLFSRKNLKTVVMAFFYGIGKSGIKTKIYQWINDFPELFSNDMHSDKKKTAQFVDELCLFIFNSLKMNYSEGYKYYTFLTKAAKFLFYQNNPIIILTSDDSTIEYSYFQIKKSHRKIRLSYQTNNLKSYTNYTYLSTLDTQHYTSFTPNYIQSIDASISREILVRVFEELNVIVEPLHDSFREHPIYVEDMYNIIKKIYINFYKDQNYLKNSFFMPSNISTAKIKRAITVVKRELHLIERKQINTSDLIINVPNYLHFKNYLKFLESFLKDFEYYEKKASEVDQSIIDFIYKSDFMFFV